MNRPARKSMLCPNCRKLISTDEPRCPHCGIRSPGSRLKNNPLTRGWGSGERLIHLIIYTNVAMFIFSLLISKGFGGGGFDLLRFLSPSPRAFGALGATGKWMVDQLGWWTLISANYLHVGAMHIFFNMLALYNIGPLITQLFGTYRFFAIYTISGVGGFLASYVIGINSTVGASAALFGLFGAAIYYGKSRGGVFGETIYKQIGGWAIYFIILGFLVPQINNSGHIGGLVSGGIIAFLLGYNEKKRESAGHRILAGGCMVVTLLILLWMLVRGMRFWLGI